MQKIIPEILKGKSKPETKINIYHCPKGHEVVTIERDEGTTPMMIDCRHEENGKRCNQISKSKWYACDQTLTPTHEWYRPAPGEKIEKIFRQYVKDGGLIIRRIGEVKQATVVSIKKIGRNDPCPCGKQEKFKNCCINNPLYSQYK